jgi:hypothetical protein
VDFVVENSKKLPKIEFGSWKNHLSPQCVHIVEFGNFEILKNKKCVHTWANITSHTKKSSIENIFNDIENLKTTFPIALKVHKLCNFHLPNLLRVTFH